MALHPDFPRDPFVVIEPHLRWGAQQGDVEPEEAAFLLPPLVAEIRKGVHQWRDSGYPGVSATSRALLRHWFGSKHLIPQADGTVTEFRWYFAQREAVETAIWLYEHETARDPYSLIRYDASELVSKRMFAETWTRYVFKLATGAGKTKVLSLLMAWSYFHKSYEPGSTLSTNFLLIAPNIIVLDRLRDDFEGLRIFSSDPVLPANGYEGRNWQNDFQMTLHLQDEVGVVSETGNLFLTNVHRVYEGSPSPSFSDEDVSDFFLGSKPVTKTTKKVLDLGDVVQTLDHVVVLNDEAHHIHDESLAWFRAIETLDAKMRQRLGHGVSAQFDVTATPKNQSGAIFVQTVCSYPLVEAIRQGVVKTPVVPDEESRKRLIEHPSDKVTERYADHIKLGYLEWAKRRDDLEKVGKKPVLFVMTTTTAEADEVAEYLERTFPELTDKVLTIHTKASGELSGKEAELEVLRAASRAIDSDDNPYLAVVSVLVLREGWDVENVISMVGLRPYTASAKVLPEQTLGRGLRRMFRNDTNLIEYVSVVGTEAFLEFVDEIRKEGVELEEGEMGPTSKPRMPLLIEPDTENKAKDLDELDIPIPRLSARIQRETKNLDELDVESMPAPKLKLRKFSEEEQRRIVFKDLDTEEEAWATDLGEAVAATPQAVLAFLTKELMRRLRLVGGQEVIFGKMKQYCRDCLFENPVDLEEPNVLRNLCEIEARRHILEGFAVAINDLTIVDQGSTEVLSEISMTKVRPVQVAVQEYITSEKTVFNKIVGDSLLELEFAQWLDGAKDVEAFFRNHQTIRFFIEYVNASGEIAHYYPDFVIRDAGKTVWVVETKGLQDLDVAPKWKRLVQWCEDATALDRHKRTFSPLYLSQDDFNEITAQVATMSRLSELLDGREPIGARS